MSESLPSNEKVARLRAVFDDRTKEFRRSHSEALFNEYGRLQRENTALRNLAENLRPGPISEALTGKMDEEYQRAGIEPGTDELYALLVRRGYSQHEANDIANMTPDEPASDTSKRLLQEVLDEVDLESTPMLQSEIADFLSGIPWPNTSTQPQRAPHLREPPHCSTCSCGMASQPRANEPTAPRPETSGVGDYCTVGPASKQCMKFLVMYEDHERGISVYADEQEARTAFAKSEALGWNCHLFGLLRRAAQPPVDDLQQAARLLHIVRAWYWRAGDEADSARVDPLYPERGTSSNKASLFAAISALLERYPYGGTSLTKGAG